MLTDSIIKYEPHSSYEKDFESMYREINLPMTCIPVALSKTSHVLEVFVPDVQKPLSSIKNEIMNAAAKHYGSSYQPDDIIVSVKDSIRWAKGIKDASSTHIREILASGGLITCQKKKKSKKAKNKKSHNEQQIQQMSNSSKEDETTKLLLSFQQQLDAIKVDNTTLKKELEDIKAENITIKADNINMKKELEDIKAENITIKADNINMKKELEDIKAENITLKKDLNTLQARVTTLELREHTMCIDDILQNGILNIKKKILGTFEEQLPNLTLENKWSEFESAMKKKNLVTESSYDDVSKFLKATRPIREQNRPHLDRNFRCYSRNDVPTSSKMAQHCG